MTKPLLAAIEAGGTKFICAVGWPGTTIESVSIHTRTPDATLAKVCAFFDSAIKKHGMVKGLGIASFGPIELLRSSPDYGRLSTTPKPGWKNFDMLGALRHIIGVPSAIDTDVNAAALAEAKLGAAQNCDPVAYVTIGTGIGVGVMVGDRPLHGLGHPEGGHIWPRKHAAHHDFKGVCPYHGDCIEGLASGPALFAAWGLSPTEMPADHPAWDAESDYLGQLCATLTLILAPQRIVLGGGVMKRMELYPRIRARTRHWLNGFIASLHDDPTALDRFIVPPGCAQPSGLAGAFLLAESALADTENRFGQMRDPAGEIGLA